MQSTNTNQFAYVLAKGAKGYTAASYGLYNEAHGLVFYIYDGSNPAYQSPNAGVGIWDGRWHHVAGTFDGATVWLFVDGVEVGTPAPATIAYGLPTTNDLVIGAYRGSNFLPFSGQVDEVTVYNRALTTPEIQSLYAVESLGGGAPRILDNTPAGNLRDMLIAGASANRLIGGEGGDALIGGTTAYETDPAALQALAAYRAETDDYGTRVGRLLSGLPGVAPQLDATRVRSNGGRTDPALAGVALEGV